APTGSVDGSGAGEARRTSRTGRTSSSRHLGVRPHRGRHGSGCGFVSTIPGGARQELIDDGAGELPAATDPQRRDRELPAAELPVDGLHRHAEALGDLAGGEHVAHATLSSSSISSRNRPERVTCSTSATRNWVLIEGTFLPRSHWLTADWPT